MSAVKFDGAYVSTTHGSSPMRNAHKTRKTIHKIKSAAVRFSCTGISHSASIQLKLSEWIRFLRAILLLIFLKASILETCSYTSVMEYSCGCCFELFRKIFANGYQNLHLIRWFVELESKFSKNFKELWTKIVFVFPTKCH